MDKSNLADKHVAQEGSTTTASQNNTAMSILSFNSSNSQVVKTINAPLDKVPTAESNSQKKLADKEMVTTEAKYITETAQSDEDSTDNGKEEPKYFKSTDSSIEEAIPYTAFSRWQLTTIFCIVIFVGFLGPMSGNIYIPALPTLQDAFNVSLTTINATVSVFMAVFAVGPLFWGHWADRCGRKWLYICSLTLMTVMNILLAAVPANIGGLYVLRIFQAFGSSSVISLGTGTVTDITPPKHRGKAIAYFMLGPNLGPVIGPIVAGLLLLKGNNWRWLFGFTAILSGVAVFLIVALLPETLRCIVGNGDRKWCKYKESEKATDQYYSQTEAFDKSNITEKSMPENPKPSWRLFSDIGIQKPVTDDPTFKNLYPKPRKAGLTSYYRMLKFLPVVITSVGTALLFANYYAMSVTFSYFLQTDYQFSRFGAGLAYICPGISMIVGSQTGGHLSDFLRKKWLARHPDVKFPLELRLGLQIWGITVNTVGCIGYGWAIQKHLNVVVVFVFTAFNAFGLTWCSNTTMTYLTELLAMKAASTVAFSSLFRNAAAAISAAVIIKLVEKMGVGWCFTGLGFCNAIPLLGVLYLLKSGSKWNPLEL